MSDSDGSRREFLRRVAILGAVPFLPNLPTGLVPVALADTPKIPGKEQLTVLNDRPINAETPAPLLAATVTPNELHFVRNNGLVPQRANDASLDGWKLVIDGEVDEPLELTLDDLKQFPTHEANLVLECGGNGRAGYHPPASGNQWTLGAVGCSRWGGVKLSDVLKRAGVKQSAVYIGYYGEDRHPSGDPDKVVISRGVPIDKAMDGHCMLAWSMNGEPLPALHGFPLRLVCPGFPASTSGKWLERITVRDRVHDGPKMGGTSYRVPKHPVKPGAEVAEADMKIIEQMPVKSIITTPVTGASAGVGEAIELKGHAWSGHGDVTAVHVSVDFGATWTRTELGKPANRFAWQQWTATVSLDTPGYYEVWARATDEAGQMQPMVVPGWNPKGYLNNAMHRISLQVTA